MADRNLCLLLTDEEALIIQFAHYLCPKKFFLEVVIFLALLFSSGSIHKIV